MKSLKYLFFLFFFIGCDEAFDYSPYEAEVKDSYKNTGNRNINSIKKLNTSNKEVFKFAVIADSHYRYHELDEAIKILNRMDSIDFVIANGDITNNGYLKEFELFHDQMEGIKYPYLTVIGNHDYKSNGEKIYSDIYGKENYTIEYNNCLFIMFDNTFWESNKQPDFEWLENQLLVSSDFEKVFVVCHQPPFTSQFNDSTEELYKNLMVSYEVDLSIHGHTHHYEYGNKYNDPTKYLVVGAIVKEEFAVITVSKDFIQIEQIKY